MPIINTDELKIYIKQVKECQDRYRYSEYQDLGITIGKPTGAPVQIYKSSSSGKGYYTAYFSGAKPKQTKGHQLTNIFKD